MIQSVFIYINISDMNIEKIFETDSTDIYSLRYISCGCFVFYRHSINILIKCRYLLFRPYIHYTSTV